MYITVKLSLKLNNCQKHELIMYEEDMHREITRIVGVFKSKGKVFEYPYKNISNHISWYSKSITLRSAKRIFYNTKSKSDVPISYSSVWSNYSYEILNDCITIELGRDKKSRKVSLPFYYHSQQMHQLGQGKLCELTIVRKKHHWYAYVVVDIKHIEKTSCNKKMGIDVGIKNPAVVYTQDAKVKFFGNGRERAFIQRRYRKHIQKMQELKQIERLKDFEHKLHRKLTYYDHKISKEIIDYAQANKIGLIVMENLTNINKSFDIVITKDIYLWSYHRIQKYIAYKAEIAGIQIKYVDPRNTSKRCPTCGKLNKPKDRLYTCSCGFRSHRDIVGARNIMLAL